MLAPATTFRVPERLSSRCSTSVENSAWLERLPGVARELAGRWSLTLGAPFEGVEGSSAWVAPAQRRDGALCVMKLGMPHMEAQHEIDGLRFWNGDPTVRLLEADAEHNAMLLERCEPASYLRALPEFEQDEVIAGLLRRLWRAPPPESPFRPLAAMTACWSEQTLAETAQRPAPDLASEGLTLFRELPRSAPASVLLATDLHAGNVLRAAREPWLVIDPKPFVGDPAYDATQHLLNCSARVRLDPDRTIRRFAELLELDHERVRLWLFARAAAQPQEVWHTESLGALARSIAP